jgi:hypothetical protein
MVIEKTKKEIIIRLPSTIDMTGLQRFVDYLCYKEATANTVATQSDIDILSKDVKKGWWASNKNRLLEC